MKMAVETGLSLRDSADAGRTYPRPAVVDASTRPPASPGHAAALALLLQDVAASDQKALRRLYDLTSAKLYGVILRIVRDASDADDVLQDVYLTIWRRADRYDVRQGAAITWLCVVARNRAIDLLRRRPSAALRAAESELDAVPDTAPSTLTRLACDDHSRELQAILDRLDPRAAWAIRTAFFADMTYAQLAQQEGVPLATMKSRIRRGLLELRERLRVEA